MRMLILTLMLSLAPAMAMANQCSFKPLTPMGKEWCEAVCLCDSGGQCQWVYICD